MTTTSSSPKKKLGLYLHIPFCVRKCNYCDFLSYGNVPAEEKKTYFTALRREIKDMGRVYGNIYYVDSIFIGGGTPSLVEETLIEELIAAVRGSFYVDGNAEISLESNPGTLNKSKLDTYLNAGINRLSIGVQSMSDSLLKSLGRVHTAGDFLRNYKLARECGFQNINIDLMFGIPGQTADIWADTLKRSLELEPEHISFYSLQIEEGTPFFELYREGTIKIDEKLDRNMYHKAIKQLRENGYQHYEISNAAKDGYSCRHNLKYWSMEDYLGMGLGAHSFLGGIRYGNVPDLSSYIQIGLQNDGTEDSFHECSHINTNEENISEYLFTGMRRLAGVDLNDFEIRFGRRLEDVYSSNWHKLQKFIDEGYLIHRNETLRFSVKGVDISNVILTEFV